MTMTETKKDFFAQLCGYEYSYFCLFQWLIFISAKAVTSHERHGISNHMELQHLFI